MPGSVVLDIEANFLIPLISNIFGHHLLLVGCQDYLPVLGAARVRHCTWIRSLSGAGPPPDPPTTAAPLSQVRGDARSLPFASDSIDIVILPHVIEFEKKPYLLLQEVERVLVPEGHIVLACYNAFGLMGAWNLVQRRDAPWNGRFYSAPQVRDRLSGLGFDTVATDGCFFRPPLPSGRVLRRLQVFESVGSRFWPGLCGTWFLVARKRTATLTPLRPRWRRRRKPIREAGLAGSAMREHGCFAADDAA